MLARNEVKVHTADGLVLPGQLRVPSAAIGLVIFAHGSGSSRLSPRNQFVAGVLNDAAVATLLFDLLTPAEAQDRELVFDIDLLADRLGAAIASVADWPAVSDLPIGLFGASTGAAAALRAAAVSQAVVAVVCRGGRPDLAGSVLPSVSAPTLLLVGGADPEVLRLNRAAAAELRCRHELQVVPGASHLFEEPGALEAVAGSAAAWFGAEFGQIAASRT